MKYRRLGKTGIEVGELGMGLEHLLDKDEGVVIETIKTAVAVGVNYFDCLSLPEYSAETGTNEGYVKLGKALVGLRDGVTLSFLAFINKPLDYISADFECFLRALRTEYADVFMIACCDKPVEFESVTGTGGLLMFAEELRKSGKIRHIGISTHSAEIAYRAIANGRFDVLMFPVNPAFDVIDDEEKYNHDILGNIWDEAYAFDPNAKGGARPRQGVYAECERSGVGLVAMKPFAGGFILGVEKEAGFTPLNLVSYALAQNGVSTVVPGCSSPGEIAEILTYYDRPREDLDYGAAVAKSRWSVKGNCLYCGHCMPCPAGINVAETNKLLDGLENGVSGGGQLIIEKYNKLAVKASSCKKCGGCSERCPFGVDGVKRMERAAKLLG